MVPTYKESCHGYRHSCTHTFDESLLPQPQYEPVTDGQNEAHSSETTHHDCSEKQEGLPIEGQPPACQQYESYSEQI